MIKLANIFKDGAVLQRGMEIKIWGTFHSEKEIVLEFCGSTYKTTSNNKGYFEFILPKMEAGGSYEMKIDSLILKDIKIGDVFILSGQSNMETPMERLRRLFPEEFGSPNEDNIRQYTVFPNFNFNDNNDEIVDSSWVSVNESSIDSFSAVGYFFAKKLYETNRVPIGLILAAVGGTPIESWMSRSSLCAWPEKLKLADECKIDGFMQNIEEEDNKREKEWFSILNKYDRGLNEKWFLEEFPLEGFKKISLTHPWDIVPDLKAPGVVWLIKDVTLDQDQAQEASLILGCIVDADDVYVNGEHIGGTTYKYPPRDYAVNNLKKGLNRIAIRVVAVHGMGGFVENKSYKLLLGDKEICLLGGWFYKRSVSMPELSPRTFFRNRPTGNYNAMIKPLHPLKVKGVLWYQGESNTGEPHGYNDKFESMLKDWRKGWGYTLPFLYVQLANFSPKGPLMNWELLREEQRMGLNIEETRMVVTMDAGETNDIHPLDKKRVGERLALCARNLIYDEDIVCEGPSLTSCEKAGNSLTLYFNQNIKDVKIARGLSIWVNDCEINVEGKISENTILVETPYASEVTHISYAYIDDDINANLFNEDNLPAVPFKVVIGV